jgi:hypothetical protein
MEIIKRIVPADIPRIDGREVPALGREGWALLVPVDGQLQSVSDVQLGFRQKPEEHVNPDLQLESEPQVPPQEFGVPGQAQLVTVLQLGFRQKP